MIASCGQGLSPSWGAGVEGGGGGKGSGGGSCVGQVLAHFSQPLGRFGRRVGRAQIKSLRWPVTITSIIKTLTQRHCEVGIPQLQTLPVQPRAVTAPLHRVAPGHGCQGQLQNLQGQRGAFGQRLPNAFLCTSENLNLSSTLPGTFISFLRISKTHSFAWDSACSAGYFGAWRWIVMQMPLIFLGLSYSCGFQ